MPIHRMLCIVSQQHVPNVLAVLHFQPEHLHLLVTQSMHARGAAEVFLEALRGVGWPPEGRISTVRVDREDYVGDAGDVLQQLQLRFSADHWTVMTTGGTKPIATAAYTLFAQEAHARVYYMSVEAPTVFVDQVTGEREPCRPRLTVDQFLAACGAIREPGRLAPSPDDVQVSRSFVMHPERRKRWHERFKKEGDWLEVFFFGLLQRFSQALGLTDVQVGSKFVLTLYDARVEGEVSIENEFDAYCTYANRLFVVECKRSLPLPPQDLPGADRRPKDARGSAFLNAQYLLVARALMLRSLGIHCALAVGADVAGYGRSLARADHYGIAVLAEPELRVLEAAWQTDSPAAVRTALAGWLH